MFFLGIYYFLKFQCCVFVVVMVTVFVSAWVKILIHFFPSLFFFLISLIYLFVYFSLSF